MKLFRAIPFNFRIFCLSVIFLVIGLALYSRVISHGTFLFDDAEYVVNNLLITDSVAALTSNDARQLGYLSFALNYAAGGESPFGYHLVNVIIHVINSLLIVLMTNVFFRLMSGGRKLPLWAAYASCFTGLLFLVHPVHTQAVSYITQRFTSLATLFYLLSICLYLVARERQEKNGLSGLSYGLIAISFVSTAAAMRTKEIAFTIPIMLFVMEKLLFRSSQFGRRRFILLVPFAMSLVIIPLSIFGPELGVIKASSDIADIIRTDKIYDMTQRSPVYYFFTELRAVVVYIRLLIIPVGLRAVYDFRISKTFFEPAVFASFFLLLSLAACGRYLWRKSVAHIEYSERALAFAIAAIGMVWFFVSSSVESSVIPIKDLIFEHRIYLPSVGFFMAFATLIMFWSERCGAGCVDDTSGQAHFIKKTIIMSVILLPLAAGTFIRNDVWVNELNFWADVVRKSPNKAIGYGNRAAVYAKSGDYKNAIEDYNRMIAFFPKSMEDLFAWENSDFSPWNMSKAYTGRGNLYVALGDANKAREDFRRAKEVFSMPVDADNLLIDADKYARQKEYRQAIFLYNRILEWDPEHVRALNDRANAYSYLKRFPEAISDFTRVIALEPSYVLAYYNRGVAYAWSGRKNSAIYDFKKACQMGFGPACKSFDSEDGGTIINK